MFQTPPTLPIDEGSSADLKFSSQQCKTGLDNSKFTITLPVQLAHKSQFENCGHRSRSKCAAIPGSWSGSKGNSFAANSPLTKSVSPALPENFGCNIPICTKSDKSAKSQPLARRVAESHMSGPLLPEDAELDFEPLASQKGMTNVSSAIPLASVWEFHASEGNDECSLLHILTHELENINLKQPDTSVWAVLKGLAFGLGDEEYEAEHPWAKYTIRESSGSDSSWK